MAVCGAWFDLQWLASLKRTGQCMHLGWIRKAQPRRQVCCNSSKRVWASSSRILRRRMPARKLGTPCFLVRIWVGCDTPQSGRSGYVLPYVVVAVAVRPSVQIAGACVYLRKMTMSQKLPEVTACVQRFQHLLLFHDSSSDASTTATCVTGQFAVASVASEETVLDAAWMERGCVTVETITRPFS